MSLIHSPQIVTNGLILCVDGANKKSYPGSGAAWSDISGSGNDGTLVNSPTYNSSNYGYLVFNGTNNYVTIPDNANLRFNSTQAFTLSVWAKPAALPNGWWGIVTKSRDSSPWYGIWIDPSNRITWGSSTNNIFGPVITTQWQNIVISKDSSARYMYLNGVLINTTAGAIDVSGTAALNIGNSSSAVGEYFNGSIQAVKLYNRSLTQAEITQNFNALRGRYGI